MNYILTATNKQRCSVSFFGKSEEECYEKFDEKWERKGFKFYVEEVEEIGGI